MKKNFLFGSLGIIFISILLSTCNGISERASQYGKQVAATYYAAGINKIIREYYKRFNKPPSSFEELNKVSLKQTPNNETITYIGPACPKDIAFKDCDKSRHVEPKGTFFTLHHGLYNVELINDKKRTFIKIIPTDINQLGASSCFNHETGNYNTYYQPSHLKKSFNLYTSTQRSFLGKNIPLEYC